MLFEEAHEALFIPHLEPTITISLLDVLMSDQQIAVCLAPIVGPSEPAMLTMQVE